MRRRSHTGRCSCKRTGPRPKQPERAERDHFGRFAIEFAAFDKSTFLIAWLLVFARAMTVISMALASNAPVAPISVMLATAIVFAGAPEPKRSTPCVNAIFNQAQQQHTKGNADANKNQTKITEQSFQNQSFYLHFTHILNSIST